MMFVPTLCPLSVSPFDFSRSRELIERAAQPTKKWIDEGGLERTALPWYEQCNTQTNRLWNSMICCRTLLIGSTIQIPMSRGHLSDEGLNI
jgi:hypothetical protein